MLTPLWAQRIVKRIMPLVDNQNINLMNQDGMIIGSGAAHRIGTLHEGAIQVLREEGIVEISSSQDGKYAGSLPGVNLPIRLSNQIIGVVGVTGEPEIVRPIAQMVQGFAELLLEREMLLENLHSQMMLREQLLQLLLADPPVPIERIRGAGRLLGYNEDLPRQVIRILPILHHLPASITDMSTLTLFKRFQDQLDDSGLLQPDDFLSPHGDQLILLRSSTAPRQSSDQVLSQIFHSLRTILPIKIGAGSWVQGEAQLAASDQEARYILGRTTTWGSIRQPEWLSEYLTNQLSKERSIPGLENFLTDLSPKLLQTYDLPRTLKALLSTGGNVSQTAKQLFIHRNTLLFRLGKLKEHTGLDPIHSFNHQLICKLLADALDNHKAFK